MTSRAQHDRMANAIRALAMDAVEQAKSGHPGLPMGAADIATVLFGQFLKFDPVAPAWPDRDRFVLSAGHGSMLIYAVLHLLGYERMTIEEIKRFRQLGSLTPGHPEFGHTPGVETTTGPLGQGLANAVGMAIAERHMAAVFGRDIVDQVKRFEAAGWAACRVDGHDAEAIAAALAQAEGSDRPSLIACRTTIGFGAPTKAGSEKAHGSPLGADEIKGARERLGWNWPPFEVPAD